MIFSFSLLFLCCLGLVFFVCVCWGKKHSTSNVQGKYSTPQPHPPEEISFRDHYSVPNQDGAFEIHNLVLPLESPLRKGLSLHSLPVCQYFSSKSKLGDRVHLLHLFRKAINYFLLGQKLYHLLYLPKQDSRRETDNIRSFPFQFQAGPEGEEKPRGRKLKTPSLSLLLRDWDLAVPYIP